MATKLLDGVTADGNGPIVSGADITQFQNQEVLVGVRSTDFGGGTVTIYSGETDTEANLMPLLDGEYTASEVRSMIVQHSWFYQARLAGATSPAAVTCVAGGD